MRIKTLQQRNETAQKIEVKKLLKCGRSRIGQQKLTRQKKRQHQISSVSRTICAADGKACSTFCVASASHSPATSFRCCRKRVQKIRNRSRRKSAKRVAAVGIYNLRVRKRIPRNSVDDGETRVQQTKTEIIFLQFSAHFSAKGRVWIRRCRHQSGQRAWKEKGIAKKCWCFIQKSWILLPLREHIYCNLALRNHRILQLVLQIHWFLSYRVLRQHFLKKAVESAKGHSLIRNVAAATFVKED